MPQKMSKFPLVDEPIQTFGDLLEALTGVPEPRRLPIFVRPGKSLTAFEIHGVHVEGGKIVFETSRQFFDSNGGDV